MTYTEFASQHKKALPLIYQLVKPSYKERNESIEIFASKTILQEEVINVKRYGHKKVLNDGIKFYKHISVACFLFASTTIFSQKYQKVDNQDSVIFLQNAINSASYYRQMSQDNSTFDVGLSEAKCSYNLVPALREIDSLADFFDIVFINESHDKDNHRVFAKDICKVLSKKKYELLFLESSKAKEDELPQSFPYAMQGENSMGNNANYYELAYFANAVGFQNYPFQFTNRLSKRDTIIDGVKNKVFYYGNELYMRTVVDSRDSLIDMYLVGNSFALDAMKNILAVKKRFSDKKAIIFMGYSHAERCNSCEAGILSRLTNYKVLTVNQSTFSETSKMGYPLANLESRMKSISSPVVLKNSIDNSYKIDCIEYKYKNKFDLYVVHPKLYWENERPSWLVNDTDRVEFTLPQKIRKNNIVECKAYLNKDYEKFGNRAVPIDAAYGDKIKQIYLFRAEKILIQAKDSEGKVYKIKTYVR